VRLRSYPSMLLLVASVACTGTPTSETTSPPVPSSPVATDRASPSGTPIDLDTLRGTIVFSSETQDVWVARANGTEARRLTTAPAQEFDPTWSPDGSRIAYRHQTEGDDTTEIFVMDADGSDPRRLTHNDVADWGPDWSPDGRSILWNSAVGTGGFGFVGATMRPDGSDVHHVTRHYVEYPAWSPDGTRIAFMAQEPGATGNDPDYNIFVMDADGSNLHRLTTAPGEDGWPTWSPDGSRIVFASARDDCSISDAPDCRTTGDVGPWEDVWITNADGSNQHRLTPEFGRFFAWSPDGRAILVAGHRRCS
jgi:Tol biopolymer transport system component